MNKLNDNNEALDFFQELFLKLGKGQVDEQFLKNATNEALEEYERLVSQVDSKAKEIVIDEKTLKPPYYIVETNKGDLELWNIYDELFTKNGAKNIALASAIKYIRRAGFKDKSKAIEDFKKALICLEEYAKRI